MSSPALRDEVIVPSTMKFKTITLKEYKEIHATSINKIEEFWSKEAENLIWSQKFSKPLLGEGPKAEWFIGGLLSPYENIILRHRQSWVWIKPALIYLNEKNESTVVMYSDLNSLAEKVSQGLYDLGLRPGNWVAVYSPPSVESFVFMLAALKAGMPFEQIFTGFSPSEMARRVVSRGVKSLFITPSYVRRGKEISILSAGRPFLEKIAKMGVKVIIDDNRSGVPNFSEFIPLSQLLASKPNAQNAILRAEEPLFGLHSGYEEGFKPLAHPAGGYLVQVYATSRWIGFKPKDVIFCTVWPGWITSMAYQFFGPLMHGATVILYDGGPDWPTWGRWLDIIDSFSATIFITTGSALRIMSKQDTSLFKDKNSSLKEIIITAEPLEPPYWYWTYENIGTLPYPVINSGPKGGTIPVTCMFIQSEVGTFFTGNLIDYAFAPIKPSSVGLPFPGFSVDVVDNEGSPIRGKPGRLVIRNAWPSTPIEAPEDFHKSWSYGYYDTRDLAIMDAEGYIFPLGRRDAVMKVSGYRLSPGALEEAARSAGAEWALALPLKDSERLEVPVLLYYGGVKEEDLVKAARETVGPIATPVKVIKIERKPTGRIPREVLTSLTRKGELESAIRLLLS